MPPVAQGQSGQVHDDASLPVPQLSATATADSFESDWNCDIVENETSHSRRLGDGLFLKRWETVTRLPTRFHRLVTAPPIPVKSPIHHAGATPQFGLVALLVLSCRLSVFLLP
jgi:hypothetical protein